jgi:hypothetical protein
MSARTIILAVTMVLAAMPVCAGPATIPCATPKFLLQKRINVGDRFG